MKRKEKISLNRILNYIYSIDDNINVGVLSKDYLMKNFYVPSSFSYSMLFRFIECKIAFLLEYGFNFRKPVIYDVVIGKIFHSIVEGYFKEYWKDGLSENYKYISTYVKKVSNKITSNIEDMDKFKLKKFDNIENELNNISLFKEFDIKFYPSNGNYLLFSKNDIHKLKLFFLSYNWDDFENYFVEFITWLKNTIDCDSVLNIFIEQRKNFLYQDKYFTSVYDLCFITSDTRHIIELKFGKYYNFLQLLTYALPFITNKENIDNIFYIYSFFERKKYKIKFEYNDKRIEKLLKYFDLLKKYIYGVRERLDEIFVYYEENISKYNNVILQYYDEHVPYSFSPYILMQFIFTLFVGALIKFNEKYDINLGNRKFCNNCIYRIYCLDFLKKINLKK